MLFTQVQPAYPGTLNTSTIPSTEQRQLGPGSKQGQSWAGARKVLETLGSHGISPSPPGLTPHLGTGLTTP